VLDRADESVIRPVGGDHSGRRRWQRDLL